jgi:hypothetical protein
MTFAPVSQPQTQQHCPTHAPTLSRSLPRSPESSRNTFQDVPLSLVSDMSVGCSAGQEATSEIASSASAMHSNTRNMVEGPPATQQDGQFGIFAPILQGTVTGSVALRWPPKPSVQDEAEAAACELHAELHVERLPDDDPPSGSRGSTDQHPVILQVLCEDEAQNSDVVPLEDLSRIPQQLQGLGSWANRAGTISDSGLLDWPLIAGAKNGNQSFPDSESVDGWPSIILEKVLEDECRHNDAITVEDFPPTIEHSGGIRSWDSQAGTVSIFDCPQRPAVASPAKGIQTLSGSESTVPSAFRSNIASTKELERVAYSSPPPSSIFDAPSRDSTILLQPETRPITQEQLVNEVKGICAGLVMVKKKCVEIDQQQSSTTNKLSNEQWQALIALHRTLLHEHHDFFLASQHPSSSPALRRLATKYAMPARMWRHGIHSFLELLHTRLPHSLDHMLAFVYLAYSMMPLLMESVPTFEETWTDCLGDLARYRMAIEEADLRDREVWSGVARMWYNKASDKSPNMGRIQQSKIRGPTTAKSPNVWEMIKQFLNRKASTSGIAVKADGKLVSDRVANGGPKQRLKRFLPMFINGLRYNTTADTGSQENAISADEARRLGLKIHGKGRRFLMGNGTETISLGSVRPKCAFALGDPHVTRQLFNVIENLAVPVIIGKTFLDISKTLTLHQHRLEAVWTTAKKAFRVMHLNRPRQLMRCYVNGNLVHANPDTGSEVDLISPSYAHENTLKIESLDDGEEWVQFADGSTAKLLGKTQVEFDVYDGRSRSPTGYVGHSRTFYLLDGLRTDVLLGEEALYDMNIFADHEDSFVDSGDCELLAEINTITWFDKRARQMSDALAVLSSASSKQSKSFSQQRSCLVVAQQSVLQLSPFTDFLFPVTRSEAQDLLSKLDARELHQRELASQKLAALPAAERDAQKRFEDARKSAYDTARIALVQKRNAAAHVPSQRHIPSPAHDPG